MFVSSSNSKNDKTGTRERILSAAEELFVGHGYSSTSVREIASKAGVNIALINYHFGSKEDLYKELLGRKVTPMMKIIEEIAGEPGAPGSRKLERLIDAYLDFVFANPNMPRLLVREMSLRSGIALWFASEFVARISSSIYRIILEAEHEGYLRPGINVSVAVPSFIGCIIFNVIAHPAVRIIQERLGLEPMNVEQQKREVKNVIFKGIGGFAGDCGDPAGRIVRQEG
jgi:AcrR family transcriptional regulator